MVAALDIGRLATRVRAEPARADTLAGEVRSAASGRLAAALEGAAERALVRAGLPPEAAVAVRRLDLRLRVGGDTDVALLSRCWADALEEALAARLAAAPALAGDDPPLVRFDDVFAAERCHLERRVEGLPDAWWAPALAGGGTADASALEASAILHRWLDRDPPRAIRAMAELALTHPGVPALLNPAEARNLARAIILRLAAPSSRPMAAGPGGEPEGSDSPRGNSPAADYLAAALECCAGAGAALESASQAEPWRAAALFARFPSATGLSAGLIEAALERRFRPGTPGGNQAAESLPPPFGAAPPVACSRDRDSPESPAGRCLATPGGAEQGVRSISPTTTDTPPSAAGAEVFCGGLLLLVRPLQRLGLLPEPADLAPRLAGLALLALRKVLAGLPRGEFAAALERERFLLSVFAPESDWSERIETIPVGQPEPAERLLARLQEAIPEDIAFAPGAERRVFGARPARFATAADLRLARLLLRPGTLRVFGAAAELAWPLASVDLALRRAGWDQDPGWVPWLGRNLRFVFGADP
jgi:hypothetical protein